MSLPTLALVGVIGGFGAIARFLIDGAVTTRVAAVFPLGTFAVNIVGAFLLGALAGAGLGESAMRLAGTAALGSFTTFSTWMLESQRLAEEGRDAVAWANLLGSLAAGLVAVWLGRQLGAAL